MINLRSELHLTLLGYYFKNPNAEHYVRELSRMLSVDVAHVSRELNLLACAGLFLSAERGQEKHFRLNRKYPLYKELEKLVFYTVDKKSTSERWPRIYDPSVSVDKKSTDGW